MSENEIAELEAEAVRRKIAGGLCAVAVALCVACLAGVYWHQGPRSAAFIETLLASAMAATVVLAATAIDGPIALRSRRRSDAASVGAAGIIVMWLGCFATLEAAFVAIDVIDKAGTMIDAAADRKAGSQTHVHRKKACGAHWASAANTLDAKNANKPDCKTQKAQKGLSKFEDCASGQNDATDDAADPQ
jgi:hypothetical protein